MIRKPHISSSDSEDNTPESSEHQDSGSSYRPSKSDSSSPDSGSGVSINLTPFSALNRESYPNAANPPIPASVDTRSSGERNHKGRDRTNRSPASSPVDRQAAISFKSKNSAKIRNLSNQNPNPALKIETGIN